MNTEKCLVPGCKNKPWSRGLCNTDYSAVRRLIKAGKTTMTALEQAGKVKPAIRPARRDNSWFIK